MLGKRIGCLCTCVLSTILGIAVYLSFGAYMKQMRPVDRHVVPSDFPVVVVWHDGTTNSFRGAILRNDQLSQRIKNLKNWSFLIPADKVRELRRQVARSIPSGGGYVSGDFRVLRSSKSQQLIKATGTWTGKKGDITITSVYSASRRSFTPKKAAVDNHDVRAFSGMLAAIAAYLVLSLAGMILRLAKARNERKKSGA